MGDAVLVVLDGRDTGYELLAEIVAPEGYGDWTGSVLLPNTPSVATDGELCTYT